MPLFSEKDQTISGMHPVQKPATVACNGDWPFSGTVTVAGETVTVTLSALYPPPPQLELNTANKAKTAVRKYCARIHFSVCFVEYAAPMAN